MFSLQARFVFVILVLFLIPAVAQSVPNDKITEFIGLAKSQIKTTEAAAALSSGPPEEYFRWGEQACDWVRMGKANFTDTTKNLAEFFGEDLATALVFAARKTVCPEIIDPARITLLSVRPEL